MPEDVARFTPYPPIGSHRVIGDRRTAAMVAADGTIDWFCLPNYDGQPYFGALLDAERGGHWRLGPAEVSLGTQRHLHKCPILGTYWQGEGWELELADVMPWPADERPEQLRDQRVIIRRLRAVRGRVECVMYIAPRRNFAPEVSAGRASEGVVFHCGGSGVGAAGEHLPLALWTSFPCQVDEKAAFAVFELEEGGEAWAILTVGDHSEAWSPESARGALDATAAYWDAWKESLTYTGPRDEAVRSSAMLMHLLSYAPSGSLVAAPTSSLPERIAGDRNYDYRYAWVRDASLSLASLALVGNTRGAQRFMDWLAGLDSGTESPLQVVYRVDGGTELPEERRYDLAGYRESLPVRFGNRAYKQVQLDSLGYLVECALIYLRESGNWKDEYWQMVRRAVEYTIGNWRRMDSGIWELPDEAHYVSSKVMSWVAIQRAIEIAKEIGREPESEGWQAVVDEIHAEVMERGWSEEMRSFRQRYDFDSLDASVLLIPVMGFLPADHPRVLSTVERIVERLTIDGFVYRFEPDRTLGTKDLPIGEYEGAFLPCTFWLAVTYARAGKLEEAEAILEKAEAVAGEMEVFAEEVDPRSGEFLGNIPLLFSQMEYVRAIVEIARARPLDHARLVAGELVHQVRDKLGLREPHIDGVDRGTGDG